MDPVQQPPEKRKYIIGGVILVLIIGAFVLSGGANQLISGDFGNFLPKFQYTDLAVKQTPYAPRAAKQVDWNRRMSDATMPMLPPDDTEAKKKAAEDAAKAAEDAAKAAEAAAKAAEDAAKEAAAQAQLLQDLSNSSLTITAATMPEYLEVDMTTLSKAQPVQANHYTACAKGPANVTIASAKFYAEGGYSTETAGSLFFGTKPYSADVAISNKYETPWTGDFTTLGNYQLPANTCIDFGVTISSASAKTDWQSIALTALKANVKVSYVGGIIYGAVSDNMEIYMPGSRMIFSSSKKINISEYMVSPTYVVSSQINAVYAVYRLWTPFSSKTLIKNITVTLNTKDYTSLPIAYTFASPGKIIGYKDMWSSNPTNILAVKKPITLQANTPTVIPINTIFSYGNKSYLSFYADGSVPATVGTFSLDITAVETDDTVPPDLSALKPIQVSMADAGNPKPYYAVSVYAPQKGENIWADSTSAQAKFANGDYAVSLGTLYFDEYQTDTSVPKPDLMIKTLSIKFDGAFDQKLDVQLFGNSSTGYVPVGSPQSVAAGQVMTINDIDPYADIWGGLYLKIKNIPNSDITSVINIKPRITALDIVYTQDGVLYKKGETSPSVFSVYDGSTGTKKTVPIATSLPASFGITSIGPTTLNHTGVSGLPAGNTLVDIASLPKGQTSEFTMNKACFIAQGDGNITEISYKHFIRATSPFTTIKVDIDNENIYMEPTNWTNEAAVFTPSTPISFQNGETVCLKLVVLDPLEPVSSSWFNLTGIKASTKDNVTIPAFVNGKVMSNTNSVDGPNFIIK